MFQKRAAWIFGHFTQITKNNTIIQSFKRGNVNIKTVCICPVPRRLAEKHTPVSRSVEMLPIHWVFTHTTPSSVLWPDWEVALNISKDWTNTHTHTQKWGREKIWQEKNGKKHDLGEDINTDLALIYSYVCTRPYISNTANLMWFVKKIKCGTIRQKRGNPVPQK